MDFSELKCQSSRIISKILKTKIGLFASNNQYITDIISTQFGQLTCHKNFIIRIPVAFLYLKTKYNYSLTQDS